MNISIITNLLLELANQNVSKVSPAPKTEGVARARDALALGKKVLETVDAGLQERHSSRVETKQTTEQPITPPAFIPLPLQSEIFPGARFYARLDRESAAAAAAQEQVKEIFIYLITENLGHIWISLSLRKDFLSVRCFTDNEMSGKILRENFSLIKDDLQKIGFTEVSLTSQVRNGLAGIEELLPKFEACLLNQKV